MKPKIAIMADVENWAWGRKAQHLQRWLSEDFDITIWYLKFGAVPGIFDLYHTFDLPNVSWVPEGKRCVTGITAHVWPTWGAELVKAWASRAEALHANSRLLLDDMAPFIKYTRQRELYYVPNGVCPEQFCRTAPRPPVTGGPLVVGHQGKANPRKGADVLQAAVLEAQRRGVQIDFRLLQRGHQDALSAAEMRDWYQDLDLLLVASDMDGTPNSALEAAACEVATLGNCIGNLPEFITGTSEGWNGWLMEGLVPFSFHLGPLPHRAPPAANLDYVIDQYARQLVFAARDRAELHAMGRLARATVEKSWTWQQKASNYAVMWRQALA